MVTMKSQQNVANRRNELRYRHLFNYAPICIFVIDWSKKPAIIVEANQRAALVYGYSIDEMVGMPAIHLVPEDAGPTTQTIIQKIQQGQVVTVETTHCRRDGTRFPIRLMASADPTDEGHMIVTVEDITAEIQRRSEAEAIARERLRIAQEIHDGVAQNLAGLRFKSALWSYMPSVPPGMRAALKELHDVLTQSIADIRRAIFALRPLDLAEKGFFPALTQLVNDFGDQNQLAVRLEVSGPRRALPEDYELPLFRIIQEGLNNISQHARASSVLVRLELDPIRGVSVLIRDNGCGFDPSQLQPTRQSQHFGLRQMRERILAQGGTLDIRSAPGQGTELTITLPPTAPEDNHAAD